MNNIICGPIIRKSTKEQLVVWWVSYQKSTGSFHCFHEDDEILHIPLDSEHISHFAIGERAIVHLLDIEHQLPLDTIIHYDIYLDTGVEKRNLHSLMPDICHSHQQRCSFFIESQLNNLLHGSCRNPHHKSDDSLIAGDVKIAESLEDTYKRPSVLLMTGDQIYADHVAGPMLFAIRRVIDLLGLNDEQMPAGALDTAASIFGEEPNYYDRKAQLPLTKTTKYLRPNSYNDIFTGAYVHNHLLSFAEVSAMYLLVWSPFLWDSIDLDNMPKVEKYNNLQQLELTHIRKFTAGLKQVRRLLAHISTYMIFDDHDVTDDWNLTAQWELTAYENPLAKRILGNALFGYWLFQAWGNNPTDFSGQFLEHATQYETLPNSDNQDTLINTLFDFNQWHYEIDCSPKIIVLDCRTQRWRSENNLNLPSGLMDWESLCHLQQLLIGEEAVILVSPAPIFGVKLIEAIQRLATKIGQSLAVDAENWMAHPGSANTILNIFKHPKTPKHFIILSGDVHYSFVYDVELRFKDTSPKIWQITSSGLKNQFPSTLIKILDYLNRYFYAEYSPLNLFTKRRHMKVRYRKPVNHPGRYLIEKSGLGYLELHDDASPMKIADLHNDGTETVFIDKKS